MLLPRCDVFSPFSWPGGLVARPGWASSLLDPGKMLTQPPLLMASIYACHNHLGILTESLLLLVSVTCTRPEPQWVWLGMIKPECQALMALQQSRLWPDAPLNKCKQILADHNPSYKANHGPQWRHTTLKEAANTSGRQSLATRHTIRTLWIVTSCWD